MRAIVGKEITRTNDTVACGKQRHGCNNGRICGGYEQRCVREVGLWRQQKRLKWWLHQRMSTAAYICGDEYAEVTDVGGKAWAYWVGKCWQRPTRKNRNGVSDGSNSISCRGASYKEVSRPAYQMWYHNRMNGIKTGLLDKELQQRIAAVATDDGRHGDGQNVGVSTNRK